MRSFARGVAVATVLCWLVAAAGGVAAVEQPLSCPVTVPATASVTEAIAAYNEAGVDAFAVGHFITAELCLDAALRVGASAGARAVSAGLMEVLRANLARVQGIRRNTVTNRLYIDGSGATLDYPMAASELEPLPDTSILELRGALSAEFCGYVRELFENTTEHIGYGTILGRGQYLKGKKALELDVSAPESAEWGWVEFELVQALHAALQKYVQVNPVYSQFQSPWGDEGFRVKKYLPDGEHFHKWHSDTASPTSSARILAVAIYLNDVEEGGETAFVTQGVAAKPREGSIVLFPTAPTHVHAGLPPVSGPKYLVTNFVTVVPYILRGRQKNDALKPRLPIDPPGFGTANMGVPPAQTPLSSWRAFTVAPEGVSSVVSVAPSELGRAYDGASAGVSPMLTDSVAVGRSVCVRYGVPVGQCSGAVISNLVASQIRANGLRATSLGSLMVSTYVPLIVAGVLTVALAAAAKLGVIATPGPAPVRPAVSAAVAAVALAGSSVAVLGGEWTFPPLRFGLPLGVWLWPAVALALATPSLVRAPGSTRVVALLGVVASAAGTASPFGWAGLVYVVSGSTLGAPLTLGAAVVAGVVVRTAGALAGLPMSAVVALAPEAVAFGAAWGSRHKAAGSVPLAVGAAAAVAGVVASACAIEFGAMALPGMGVVGAAVGPLCALVGLDVLALSTQLRVPPSLPLGPLVATLTLCGAALVNPVLATATARDAAIRIAGSVVVAGVFALGPAGPVSDGAAAAPAAAKEE